MQPHVSLVMPALNAERYIGAALDSVRRAAGGLEVELILADGGSKDATREIAAEYPFVRILEGPDRGLYDGLNRAIAEARGSYIAWLNSDDVLYDGGLARLYKAAQLNGHADMLTGGVSQGAALSGTAAVYPRARLSIEGLVFGIPAINARLYKSSVFREAGPFRTDVGVGADREFLARAVTRGIKGEAVASPFYHYRAHEGSLTLAGDSGARQRIWRSDVEVMRAILRMPGLSSQQAHVAALGLTLLRFKQMLASRRRTAGADAPKAGRLALDDYARIPAALRRWWKWRGKIAGY